MQQCYLQDNLDFNISNGELQKKLHGAEHFLNPLFYKSRIKNTFISLEQSLSF